MLVIPQDAEACCGSRMVQDQSLQRCTGLPLALQGGEASHILAKVLALGEPRCTQRTRLTRDTRRRGRGAASPFVPLGSSCSCGAGRWKAAGFPLLVLAQLRGEAVIHLLSCSQVCSKSTSHPVTVPTSQRRHCMAQTRTASAAATRKTCTEPGEAQSQLREVPGLRGLRAWQIHPWASSCREAASREAPSRRRAGVHAVRPRCSPTQQPQAPWCWSAAPTQPQAQEPRIITKRKGFRRIALRKEAAMLLFFKYQTQDT